MSKVYVGDTGTAIVLDVGQSLAGALAVSVEAQKPNGEAVSWTGAVFESTKVRFVTQAGSLDAPGVWRLQARVVLPSGTWLGEMAKLTVYKPFD